MAVVGLLTLEIHIEHPRSLKDKRQVLRSLKDRLRRHHNVAVAELEHQDTWQDSAVGVTTVSRTQARVEEVLRAAEDEAARVLGPDLAGSSIDFF